MRQGMRMGFGLLAGATVFIAAACSGDETPTPVPARAASNVEMEQLKAAYNATPLAPAMPDHKFIALDDGSFMFMHFDKPVGQDSTILYVGVAVPGTFTTADQERVIERYGPGFSHFHQGQCPAASPDACHGGQGGEGGFWFRHVAVGEFDMPWGHVTPGVDNNFMPTTPPL